MWLVTSSVINDFQVSCDLIFSSVHVDRHMNFQTSIVPVTLWVDARRHTFRQSFGGAFPSASSFSEGTLTQNSHVVLDGSRVKKSPAFLRRFGCCTCSEPFGVWSMAC